MDLDLDFLTFLTEAGTPYIDESVAGTGYLPRTVRGVALFLLDQDGDLDLLTAKQQVTFSRFIVPLLNDPGCQAGFLDWQNANNE